MQLSRMEKGVSLIEVLFIIGIITLAVTLVAFSFSKLNSDEVLENNAELVASVLEQARSMTLSAVEDSQYGVHLGASEVTLFKGTLYSPSDPDNIVTSLNALTSIRDITIAGGGSSVVFKRLTGSTDQTGTAEIFLEQSPEKFLTVTITGTGVVELK